MARPTQEEIITQQHKRLYIQFGGPRPGNTLQYAGQGTQYLVIEGVTKPILGGITPIRVYDPNRQGSYKNVGRSRTAPDFPSATLRLMESHGSLPFQLGDLSCPLNIYEATGRCTDLADFLRGWDDYTLIYDDVEITEASLGDRLSFEEDNAIEDELSITIGSIYPIGKMGFGEQAGTNVDREVVDIIYGSSVQCGNCGPADPGTKWIYAITKSSGSGSPGLPAEVVYTVDGGATWREAAIDGIGATEDPVAIELVGRYLVVLSRTASSATTGGYYYAVINSYTGIPGSFTKVTSGFVANKQPNDLYAGGPGDVYFAADGGYIYKSTDITSGVTVLNTSATTNNLLRIDGMDYTIVAVGEASTVVRSTNRGNTWAVTTDNPSDISLTIQSIEVLDENRYWVGTTSSGRLYFTLDGGESWTLKDFSGSGAGGVHDIVFATDSVGYFVHATNTPDARMFATWNGGQDWIISTDVSQKRMLNWPAFDRANRIAVPDAGPTISSNNVAIAGLGGNGTDGIILQASAGVK